MASWASLGAQRLRTCLTTLETQVQALGGEDPLEKEWQPTPVFLSGDSHGSGARQATAHRVAELDMTEQELEWQHLQTFAFETFTMQYYNGISEIPCPLMSTVQPCPPMSTLVHCNLFKVRNTVLTLLLPQKLVLDWYEVVCHLWMLMWCLNLTPEQADLSLLQAF